MQKDPNTRPKCALCGKNHLSNYKDCTKYENRYPTGNGTVDKILFHNKLQALNVNSANVINTHRINKHAL